MNLLSGRRVLVTGATGFIGGRVVEHLVRVQRAQVRALVRDFTKAPRIARFAIEMVPGDIRSATAVDRAVSGCDTIFHCAYGNVDEDDSRRTVTVQGTETLLEAANRHHVRRVVHVSTYAVYGFPPSGEIDEKAPRHYTGLGYGDSKIDAEELALEYCKRGLSVAVVQPTIVYGPYATTWIIKPLEQLATGRIILVNGGSGLCNAVYIDDVVAAMMEAAILDSAHGETFLISGPEPITWAQFFARLARLIRPSGTISMNPDQARAHFQRTVRAGLLTESLRVLRHETARRESFLRARLSAHQLGRAAVKMAEVLSFFPKPGQAAGQQEAAIHPVFPDKIPSFVSTARVRIDKAVRVLGYWPAYDFEIGMRTTEAWAHWANLIPNDPGSGPTRPLGFDRLE
jgi:nucleoside-diphosphate-sugar epimerase